MSAKNPGILLYLPQDELHELGLLYLHYLLKSQGKVVLNLGQSLPLEHLKHIFKDSTSFKIVVSVWTTQPLPEQVAQYAKDARSFMGSVPLWVTGLAVSDWTNTDSNIVVYPTLAQLGHALFTMA
jgi:hypothetical protein